MARSDRGGASSVLSGGFVAAAAMLIVGATALRPAMEAVARHYRKSSIAILRPLRLLDVSGLTTLASGWKAEYLEQPVEELGTDEFVYIRFDRTAGGAGPRRAEVFASYYSNPGDQVPHTPEVCYPGQGAFIEKMQAISLDAGKIAGWSGEIPAKLIIFRWPTYNEAVIYCFCAEGLLRRDREQVRWIIGKPGNRHTYFGLIKAGVQYPLGGDAGGATEMCERVFSEAVGLLVGEHMPGREQVSGR